MIINVQDIKLIEPALELESDFFAMVKEFKDEGRDIIDGIGSGRVCNLLHTL